MPERPPAPSQQNPWRIKYLRHAANSESRGTLIARMPSVSPAPAGGSIVFRCDGDERIGAGHVARCVPLAAAFGRLGWTVSFAGVYAGLASWLLERAAMNVRAPDPETPCGVTAKRFDAAVIDSYLIAEPAICDLAGALPVITLAEANRCPTRGILLDYHLDRTEQPGPRLLAGPSFAPLCPAFAGAGRAGAEVRKVLLTAGGSLPARELLAHAVPCVSAVFPDAEIVVAGSPQLETFGAFARVVELPSPSALVDVVADIDLAVTAAGLTAYEMACAGVPQVAIAIAPNQRRVVSGLRRNGLAPCLDLIGGDSLADLPSALARLTDAGARQRLSERGRSVFDGWGALRAATALTQRLLARGAASAADSDF